VRHLPVLRTLDPQATVPIMSVATSRRGFHSVTPRIVVADAAAQIAFLRTVFDATGEYHADRPAEVRIGDSRHGDACRRPRAISGVSLRLC
jgi:hypothetical protein